MWQDSQLLRQAEEGTPGYRVYEWDGVWVSLGRFQRAEVAIVPPFHRFVVRPTGGKAVLHGHDKTVALALPHRGRSVKDAYGWAVGPLVQALNRCGLPCALATSRNATHHPSPDCFASSSPYDLMSLETQGKVAGVAMAINRKALLLQMSVPYQSPLVDPKSVLVDPADCPLHDWNHSGLENALREALKEFACPT